MKHLLEVDSVIKRYNGELVISDVYLKCEIGNIIGLLGRNGSGKSTLMKIIFGVVNAETKFIRIDGKVKDRVSQLMNEVSYLPQDNFIPQNLSVKKAIDLSVDKTNRPQFYIDEMISTILKNKIWQLSGGELRYLEIKLILSKSSHFVLLDEPYNGLSPIMIEKVNSLLKVNSKNKGIIITDHSYKNVIEISNQLILIKDGKTFHLKDKMELIEKGYLREGMI